LALEFVNGLEVLVFNAEDVSRPILSVSKYRLVLRDEGWREIKL